MKTITKITLVMLAVLYMACPMHAVSPIVFNGVEYTLDKNTILLDRENLYGESLAFEDPIEMFAKVNEIGKDVTLLVAPSVYWLDDPDDPEIRTDKGGTPFGIKIKCDNLKIIGLSENPRDVVFAVNRGQTQGAVGNFTMFEFVGNSLETENITFGNYCNIDLVYPRNSQLNRQRRKDAIVQAQIGICNGTDKLFAKNCNFLSRLNLCPFVGARRSLYENCYFESTDDALSGSGVYLNCRFLFCSSKPFYTTAETGAVFLNCDIKSACSGTQYFTKIPGQVTAIDTRFTGGDNLSIDWSRDASDVKCFQHNVSVNGKPYKVDADRPELWMELDGSALMDAYVVECNGERFYNLPNLLKGNDGWDPTGMNNKVAEAEQYLGRKLTGIPVTVRMKPDKTKLVAQNDTARIAVTPLLWGGYPLDDVRELIYVSDNSASVAKEKVVKYSLSSGLIASRTLTIDPFLRMAPKFKKLPSAKFDAANGVYQVDYKLNGKGDDKSLIYWARIVQEDSVSRVYLVKKGFSNQYRPIAADYGNKLMAIVVPQFKDSKAGEPTLSSMVDVDDIDEIKDFPESKLTTDFSDIPITGRFKEATSVWNFDIHKPLDTMHVTNWDAIEGTGWFYGKGFDASVSDGLVQSERGARLSYVPSRDICHNMKAELTVEPAKSAGQGFGSATSQYMDVCLKFNTLTLDGYALRIERTPDYDKAVKFSIVKYENGFTSVINEGVASNCYRTTCHITAEIKNGIMTARAFTDAPDVNPIQPDVVKTVTLSSPVDENYLTGFCIQHTGSTGASSTLLKNLSLTWE